ncbi:WYL domain-containing protein [Calderihabitans maritimus]|uniref:TnsA endonuclease N-terminal domain-containing protein n=1 Tax=Calderihabitans maritimus TaxID=1246530 RepID=A0A1Z5HXH7_9FIRM|nr:WYL domain-containing protein [Calderihabitans maritimus]GAW93980.1 hypothetical protein STH2042 [Calderihabitans maritimus]
MREKRRRISEAIESKKKISFSYVDAEGKKTTRTVCPLVLFEYDKYLEGIRYYLTAFCELDFDYRTFRLDRMRKIRSLAEVFEPNEFSDFDFYEKLGTVFTRKRVRIIKRVDAGKKSGRQVRSLLPPTAATGVYGSVNDDIEIEEHIYGNFNDDYPKEWYSSKVKGGFCLCRSPLEEMEFEKLDNDDEVLAYEVEPFKIRYYAGSKVRYYIPDLLVTYRDGRRVIAEIKTLSEVRLEKNQAKFKAIEQYAKEHGYEFEVWARRGIGRLTGAIFDASDEGNYSSWENAVEVATRRIEKNEAERRRKQFWDNWGCLVVIMIGLAFLLIFSFLR